MIKWFKSWFKQEPLYAIEMEFGTMYNVTGELLSSHGHLLGPIVKIRLMTQEEIEKHD